MKTRETTDTGRKKNEKIVLKIAQYARSLRLLFCMVLRPLRDFTILSRCIAEHTLELTNKIIRIVVADFISNFTDGLRGYKTDRASQTGGGDRHPPGEKRLRRDRLCRLETDVSWRLKPIA